MSLISLSRSSWPLNLHCQTPFSTFCNALGYSPILADVNRHAAAMTYGHSRLHTSRLHWMCFHYQSNAGGPYFALAQTCGGKIGSYHRVVFAHGSAGVEAVAENCSSGDHCLGSASPGALGSAALTGSIPSTGQLPSAPGSIAAEYATDLYTMRVWQQSHVQGAVAITSMVACYAQGLRIAPLGQRDLWPLTFSAGSRRPVQDWHTHSAYLPPAWRTCRHERKGSCAAAPDASGMAIATATSCSSALLAWPAPLAPVSCSFEVSTK